MLRIQSFSNLNMGVKEKEGRGRDQEQSSHKQETVRQECKFFGGRTVGRAVERSRE